MEEIFKIVQLPEKYKLKHFQIFGEIKRWSNFIKHPKAFILVHHPSYYFKGDLIIEDGDNQKITFVDQKFIDNYYAGDTNNSKLYVLLTNKKDVVVVFPDLSEIISKFCISQKKFIEIIAKNDIFREILEGNSTLKDYFEGTEELEDRGIESMNES